MNKAPGRPPARIHFTSIFIENLPLWERMGLIAQRNLAEIGVDMQLEALPVDEFNARLASKRFDAVLLELVVGNSPTRPYFFWHSAGGRNVWEYNNPVVDRAIDGIRRARTDVDYRAAFRDFQASTLETPPAIFLALGETTRAVSRRFRVVAPPGSDILPTIADWQVAVDPARDSN
jgi:ABC-type transport system substrate-binding protein